LTEARARPSLPARKYRTPALARWSRYRRVLWTSPDPLLLRADFLTGD
jgi:hypothetical protein